ncbi:MAG: hypothetical protein IPG64_13720 [Haliea sp.]|nr:hypothetical protein [Haliea sp.]
MSTQIPIVSGAQPTGGHLQEFNTTPLAFLHRAYAECGEVSQFDLGGLRTVLLVGPPAHEAFFRAADEQLSAAQAYQMMVPVFGEGIQYGAPPAIERQQLKMQVQGLKHERMVNYACVVERRRSGSCAMARCGRIRYLRCVYPAHAENIHALPVGGSFASSSPRNCRALPRAGGWAGRHRRSVIRSRMPSAFARATGRGSDSKR